MEIPEGWSFTKPQKKKRMDVKDKKEVTKEGRLEIARKLKRAVALRFLEKRYRVNFELGLNKGGARRADVIALSVKGKIVIIEVKSCVQDFMTDAKCDQYMRYSNQFYFAFTKSTWKKLKPQVEFPPEVGVLVLDEFNNLKVVKASKIRDIEQKVLLGVALRIGYRGAEIKSRADLK